MELMLTRRDSRAGTLSGGDCHTVEVTVMTAVEPIRQSQIVEADQQRVFDAFVGKIATWWPIETRAIVPGAVCDVRVERQVGGRIYEVHHDGRCRSCVGTSGSLTTTALPASSSAARARSSSCSRSCRARTPSKP